MPEFGDFLNWIEKLRLGIRAQSVRQLIREFRVFARDHQLSDDVARLRGLMYDEIRDIKGDAAAEEFNQGTKR